MSELIFLGSAGFAATKNRDNVSLILRCFQDLLLIDCPGSVFQKIKKLELDPVQLKVMLVTHIHPDHIYGLPSLIHSLMLDDCSIDLYGSEASVQFCKDYLQMFNLLIEKIKCRINFKSLIPNQPFNPLPWLEGCAIKVPHHESSLAYLLRIKQEGKSLVYSGDTSLFPPVFEMASGVEYLIHDCSSTSRIFQQYPSLYKSHTNSLELGKMAEKAGVKCLIPCHFFGRENTSVPEIEKEIKKNFTRKLIMPDDFDRISL